MCPKHYRRFMTHGHTDDPVRPTRKPCSLESCDRLARRNGLCDLHSQRLRRNGDPQAVRSIQGDNERRFRQYLTVDASSGCWLWGGVRHKTQGYGRFWSGGKDGRYVQAHRWSYEFFVGAIPESLVIDHLCSVRQCVNPAHLEAVTQAENNRRAGVHTRSRRQRQHAEGGRNVKQWGN